MKGKMRLVALLLTVLVVASGCASKAEPDWDEIRKPGNIGSAQELASRAIPGWARAKEQELVVPLGISQQVPVSGAVITLEEGWFSAREYHLLYTIKSDDGRYLIPSQVRLETDGKQSVGTHGRPHIEELRQWGGFSTEGFHGVLSFWRFEKEIPGERLWLKLSGWGPVVFGESGGFHAGGEVLTLPIPWKSAYLNAPAPEVRTLSQSKSWLGRTLWVDRLEVATGEIRLMGQVELPEGEAGPHPDIQLQVGDQVLRTMGMQMEKAESAGLYRYTAQFDGPNRWPAPVKLQIGGIGFTAKGALEWPINWAKYRTQSDSKPLAKGDRVAVKFYDSVLTSWIFTGVGASVEVKNPTAKPPFVSWGHTGLGYTGPDRDELVPGFELENEKGDRMPNMGSGGGHDGKRKTISASWGDEMPDALRQSDRLTLRYLNPGAVLVLDETWVLVPK